MTIHYQDDRVTLHHGDCLDVLRSLPDASVDSVCTDPPYGLEFMGKDWDSFAPQNTTAQRSNAGGFGDEEGKPWNKARSGTKGVRSTFRCRSCQGWSGAFSEARAKRQKACGCESPDFDYAGAPAQTVAFGKWCELWAAECLRVLKPGGHLLAFGGTRTWHRLACAVEDAGFEVRDSIAWLYGSGFPKSLDVSKAIDKARDDRDDVLTLTSALADLAESAGITRAGIDEAMGTSDMGGWWLSRLRHRCACPSVDNWTRLRDLIPGARNLDADVWRLNGRKGSPGEAWDQREVIGQSAHKSGIANGTEGHHTVGGTIAEHYDITAPATDAAREWAGWGSAMKPGFEPVVVARKPLIGTIAQNVLTHGTGALNIDATRIGPPLDSAGSSRGDSTSCTCPEPAGDRTIRSLSTQPPASSEPAPDRRSDPRASAQAGDPGSSPLPDSLAGYQSSRRSGDAPALLAGVDDRASSLPLVDAPEPVALRGEGTRNPMSRSKPCPNCTAPNVESRAGQGRWPANVILDEDMAAVLDEQSGNRPGNKGLHGTHGGGRIGGVMGQKVQREYAFEGYGDSGGASRFFYVAKAPKRERPVVDGVAHPTVKPLALMRWLVRLVTPPGGVVLEPFAGSGTTVEACLLEGFRCVAIEKGDEYLPLILARIQRQADPLPEVAELTRTTDPAEAIVQQIDGQLDIFGEGQAS